MDTRHHFIQHRLHRTLRLIALCALAFAFIPDAPAQQIRPGVHIVFTRDSASVGVFHATRIDIDTGNVEVREYIKRLADSVAALKSGQDYVVYRMYGVLGSAAAQDSVNLQVGVNGVYEAIRPNFNVFAYNLSLLSTSPTERLSTFDGNKPVFNTADSLLIIRASRDTARATDKECAITIYKLPKAAGPDQNTKTVGDFYDMSSFPLSILPLGTNLFFTVDVVFRRQP